MAIGRLVGGEDAPSALDRSRTAPPPAPIKAALHLVQFLAAAVEVEVVRVLAAAVGRHLNLHPALPAPVTVALLRTVHDITPGHGTAGARLAHLVRQGTPGSLPTGKFVRA